jgi:hypothetical protein
MILICPSVLGTASAKFPRPAFFEASASSGDAVPVLAPPVLVPPEKQFLDLGAAASRS